MSKDDAAAIGSELPDLDAAGKAKLDAARLLKREGKLDEAIEALGAALEAAITAAEGDGLAPTTAVWYYEYGNALLLKAENDTDLFGDAVRAAAERKEAEQAAAAGEGGEAGGEAGGGGDGEPTDLELAWEMLERSRVIASGYDGTRSGDILHAWVLIRLGDVSMEGEQFETAIADYSNCLTLRQRHLQPHDRQLADVLTLLAMSHMYIGMKASGKAASDAYTTSADYYAQAIDVLKAAIAQLDGEGVAESKEESKEGEKSEKDELRELVAEMQLRQEDVLRLRDDPDTMRPPVDLPTAASTGSGFSKPQLDDSAPVHTLSVVRKRPAAGDASSASEPPVKKAKKK